jgi:magnesium-transporting ATPase (P-type)
MRPEPVAVLLWRQLSSPLILVLIASGVVALALGEMADGAVVLAVVAANSAIGFVQEWRAGRAIQALAALVPSARS